MEIKLGLDIGTQYCYAGYYNNQGNQENQEVFVSAVKRDDGDDNGIPTDICYNKNGRGDKYSNLLFGYDADDLRGQDGYCFLQLGTSLKTFARGIINYEDTPIYIGSEQFQFSKVFNGFIKYIAKKINENLQKKFGDNYILKEIRIAYPNTKDTVTNNYKEKLCQEVANVFKINYLDVKVNPESVYAEHFFKQIYEAKSSMKLDKFCTIDVGGGTTDFALMIWDSNQNRYKFEFIESIDFGGKYIDKLMYKAADYSKADNIPASKCIKHKIWLFDIAGDGEPIPNRITRKYEILENFNSKLQEQAQNQEENQYQHYKDMLKKCNLKSLESAGKCLYVLMGGSSVLPCVKQALLDLSTGADKDSYILNLTDIAKEEFGTTNANFLAMALASYSEPDNYAPETYIIPTINENSEEDGAIIIAHKGDMDKTRYYLSSIKVQCSGIVNGKRQFVDFGLGKNHIQRLTNDEIITSNKISQNYYKKFEADNKIKPIGNAWVGFKETIEYSKDKTFYIGTKYIPNAISDNEKLHVYIFDSETGEPYIAKRQENIDYLEFARRAGVEPKITKPQYRAQPQVPPQPQPNISPEKAKPIVPTTSTPTKMKEEKQVPRESEFMKALHIIIMLLGVIFTILGPCLTYLGETIKISMWSMTLIGIAMIVFGFVMTILKKKKR